MQIGYLQWRRDNGFQNDEEPVLQVLDGFENKDALMKEIFRKAPKDLREARAGEHTVVEPLGSDQLEIAAASDELREIGAKKKRKSIGEIRVYHERIDFFKVPEGSASLYASRSELLGKR